jgi:hypothetical protein
MEEEHMRGRYPSGPEYVDQLEGSVEAKRRAKVILETLQGRLRVGEACQALGICEQRFGQLRAELLQAAVERMESKPTGRPRRADAEASAEVAALRALLADKEMELRAAQLRVEIAAALPHVVQVAAVTEPEQVVAADTEPQKKTPPRQQRRARPEWWKKHNKPKRKPSS